MQVRLLPYLTVLLAAVLLSTSSRGNQFNGNQSDRASISFTDQMFQWLTGKKVFETADDVPPEYFRNQKEIKAIVVKVTDGDTFRVRHVTGNEKTAPRYDGALKGNTIAVRLAAVDAPETAKFGEAGQPLGEAAKVFVEERVAGKRVTVKLLSRDRYGRVVALVKYRDNAWLPNFLCTKKDISEQLLLHGMAAVYRQGGAQYDGPITRWNELEKQAIRYKRGIWMNGEQNADLPSAYKKAMNQKTRTKSREFVKI
jgi:micrococcal nuclease